MKKLIVLLIMLLSSTVQAANTKVEDLTLFYTPSSVDRMYVVDDPNGTHLGRGMPLIELFQLIDTSAELLAILGDETGTGALVFGSAPTIDSPVFTTAITATDLIDSAHYVADSIDNEHINWDDIDYLGDEGVYLWDDIGNPDADDTISLAGYEIAFSSILDEAAHTAFTINHADADVDNATRIMLIQSADNDDVDLTYFEIIDDVSGTPDTIFKVDTGVHIGADDQIAHQYIHDAGTLVFYDDSDDTSVTIGPVDDGTTTLGITGGLAATGNVYGSTMSTLSLDTGLIDATGAVDMDYGSEDITDHTFTTDSTGTAEIVLPAGSIDGTEILDDTVDSDDYAAASIDYEHLASDVITGAAAIGAFESGDTFLIMEAGVGLREADYDDLPGVGGGMDSFIVEDGDTTEVSISDAEEWKFVEGGGIDIDWTDVDPGSDADPFDLTFTVALGTDIAAAEMADADHGDVQWNSGDADVESMDLGDATTGTYYVGLFADDTGTSRPIYADAPLSYAQATGTLTAGEFAGGGGSLTGIDAATGDSATDFFDAGEIADARISDTLTSSSCTGTAAIATGVTCTDNEDEALACPIVFVDGATGTQGAETDDGDFTYNPSTGTIIATEFSGGGGSVTGVDAATGDAAVDFFGAGVDAVTDGTECTDIEGTGLAIAGGVLNWSAASTDLTDTADLLYETELDDFSEIQAQIADKTLVNTADGATWLGVHDYGGADLELPQASPAVPGVDGGVEVDFTDGTVVIQHGSAHAELGVATDVVIGKLIDSWSGTIFEPDGINDVITVKAINSIEFPHGVVITAVYLGVSSDTGYVLTVQNFDDFDTINGANPTIDTVTYSADTTGEIIDSTPTYATIAAGQIIMISIPATDVDWIHFEIYYYEPGA